MMNDLRLELAAEYLLMAAMLAEIKSRMLLPRAAQSEEEEADPRAELVRRLQEYERYKQAAEDIDRMPHLGRDVHAVEIEFPDRLVVRRPPELALREILLAFRDVMQRAALFTSHHVQREPLSVRERMTRVLDAVRNGGFVEFTQLFDMTEGRLGVVVSFMAILELIKEALIELVQTDSYGPIHVKARGG
jgi:segregation and condensation protein A